MIAVRYTLMYPQETEQLGLVDPIGLEDWKAKGVPSIRRYLYEHEFQTTAGPYSRIRAHHLLRGSLGLKYERWVQMLAG